MVRALDLISPAAATLVLVAIAAPVAAQERSGPASASAADARGSDRLIYPAAFYDQFQPQTALDLIARTPGFTLSGSGDDALVRGFGANAGNVLIDGRRPTVKAGGIEAVLARISASRVARIELLRGAQTAEAQGQALVANIVLKPGGRGSGNAAFELRRAPGDDEVTPRIDLSYALPFSGWDASAGLIAYYENNPIGGTYERFDPAGRSLERSSERFDESPRGATLTGAASRPLGGGLFSLNARLNYEREAFDQRLTPLGGAATASRFHLLDVDWDGELGADWTRGLGRDWTVKLLALGRAERSDTNEVFAGIEGSNAFTQRSRTIELVGRGTLSRGGAHRFRPEIGGEIAYNRLVNRSALSENGAAIALPGANTRVAELRGEAFANLTVQLARSLRLESGLAVEMSRITVTGDADAERTLSFWKPSAALVWDVGAKTQARLGIRRSVSQLDFEGFALAGNLIDDRPIAGNAELRPEVTLALSAGVDHRFGNGGALSLKIERETIDDALTFVLLEGGGEALLNFGSVDLWRGSTEATLPLDGLIAGARLTAKGSVIRATRPDPVGDGRRRDYRDGWSAEGGFRHDLARLRSAYGFSIEAESPERTWFVAEFERIRTRPYVTSYVETAAIPGFKTTLTVSGIQGEREDRLRRFFTPDRAGILTGTERRVRERGIYVNLLFSRQF